MSRQVTVSIPQRWLEGSLQIKGFIEHYTQAVRLPVVVNFDNQIDNREICLADLGNLSQEEYEAVDNAIQTLNDGLSRLHGELPWKTPTSPGTDSGNGLLYRLAELDKIFKRRKDP